MNNMSKVLRLENGDNVVITIRNPRTINVTPLKESYEVLDENKKVIGLDFNGEYSIIPEQVIKIDKQAYKILFITKELDPAKGGPAYILKPQKAITKTTNFILPLLGYNKNYFRWHSNLVNAFIGTEKGKDYGMYVYLLYRFSGNKGYTDFEETIQHHPCFMGMADPDKYHTLYQFSLPEEYEDDIGTILKGKYSEISVKAKDRILTFHESTINKPLGQILNKSDIRRKKLERELQGSIPQGNELMDLFTLQDEIFLNQYIIEDEQTKQAIAPSDSEIGEG